MALSLPKVPSIWQNKLAKIDVVFSYYGSCEFNFNHTGKKEQTHMKQFVKIQNCHFVRNVSSTYY